MISSFTKYGLICEWAYPRFTKYGLIREWASPRVGSSTGFYG